MRDDELQVLGSDKSRSKKRLLNWIALAIVGMAALISIVLTLRQYYADEAEKARAAELGNTINADLQQVTDSLLDNKLHELNGMQGQIIVMEVQTGAIKALTGLECKFDGTYQPCRNFGYQQEPGQTIMTPITLTLLETGDVRLSDKVDVGNGIWGINEGDSIKDHNWNRGGYGLINMERVLEVSSNIGISKMVNKVFKGKEMEFFSSLDKMSYGQPENIEGIPELKPMIFNSPKDSTWASNQLLWSTMGYERIMAPIQTLTFYNAIANGGKMVKPSLRLGETEVINEQISSKENIAEIQKALYHVVSEGLAKPAGTPLVPVAGKTGTADVPNYWDGSKEYHVSFCGYFPAFAPKYSIIVSLNKPGLPASGGLMAGSVFHDIVEWMVQHGCMNVDNQ